MERMKNSKLYKKLNVHPLPNHAYFHLLQETIQEAKITFPNEQDEKYKDRYYDGYYKFKYDKYINDVADWFKEWFGK